MGLPILLSYRDWSVCSVSLPRMPSFRCITLMVHEGMAWSMTSSEDSLREVDHQAYENRPLICYADWFMTVWILNESHNLILLRNIVTRNILELRPSMKA